MEPTQSSQSPLPNLVIAGVVKGGTTSIYSYLSQHPDICSSSVKETCYFSAYRYGQLDSRYDAQKMEPYEQYKGYFCHCQDQDYKYIMEATPGYFEGGNKVTAEIKKQLGDHVKIMIVLREPISRLLSFFKYKKSMLELDKSMTLDEYIEKCNQMPFSERVKQENDIYWGLDGGCYDHYIDQWCDSFGDNLKIFFFDDLKQDSKQLLKQICQWLELDSSIYEQEELEVQNKTVDYKFKFLQKTALAINNAGEKFWRSNPKLKDQLREIYYFINGQKHQEKTSDQALEYLQSFYAPHNQKLAEKLLARGYSNLPQWLQS